MKLRPALVLLLALGCSRADKLAPASAAQKPDASLATEAPKAPPAPKPVVALTPDKERALAEQLLNEAVSRHGGYIALSGNAGDQRSTIDRLQLGLSVFQAKVRFPDQPDVAGVEQGVRALATKLSLPIASVSVVAHPVARRVLPKEVPDGTQFELAPEDVRGTLSVRVVFATAPTAPLLEKLATETIALRRFLLWTQASATTLDGGPAFALVGEAYWFYPDVAAPKVAHKPPRLEDALAAVGLSANPADPAARAHLEKAKPLFAEMATKTNDYLGVLELIRQTREVHARFTWVRSARARQDAAVKALPAQLASPSPGPDR